MAWINAYERNKFDEEQKRLAEEYRATGMTEYQIEQMQQFDLDLFRGERNYQMHTQPIDMRGFEENNQDESDNSLLKKFLEVMSCTMELDESAKNRYWWIDMIENVSIVEKIKSLQQCDIELITLIVFEGYSQTDAASILQITDRAVRAHWSKIKDLFVNIL